MILTDDKGRPFERPRRENFSDAVEFAFEGRSIDERIAAQDRPTTPVPAWDDVDEIARPERTGA